MKGALRSAAVLLLACTLIGALPVEDRDLTSKAHAEGGVTLYSAMSLEDTTTLVKRFEDQYGISVAVLRMESAQVPARLAIEQRSGHNVADVVVAPGFQVNALKKSGYLTLFRPPEDRDFLNGTVDADGYWTAAFMNTDTIVYNPARLKALGLRPPSSWSDLARPEWRGQFALYSASYEWYAVMNRTLGAAAASQLMRGLAANQPGLVASHQLAINQTAAGEYAAALNAFGYDADRLKRNGQSIDFVNAPPTVAEINAIGVVKGGPHPNAARLFERWLLSRDTQTFMIAALGRVSGRKDARNNPAIWNGKMRIVISNPSDALTYIDDVHAFDAIFGIKE